MPNDIVDLPGVVEKSVKPIDKLIDTVARGVGKVYEPIHVKRMAKAKAEEIRVISKAIRDNEDISTLYANGIVNIDATDTDDIASRAAMRLGTQEIRKQQNIEQVIHFAKNELEQEEGVSSEKVDPDWTTRFMNSVEDVGNEEMQKLWGKILAGEVKKPRSFSLRTLECVKNLSQQEAQLFHRILPYLIRVGNDVFLPRNNKLLEDFGIDFGDILKLEDCGFIVSAHDLVLSFTLKSVNDRLYIFNGADTAILFKADNEVNSAEVIFEQYGLTIAAQELYSVLAENNSREYLMRYARDLKQITMVRPIKISVHAVTAYRKNGSISYEDPDLLINRNNH